MKRHGARLENPPRGSARRRRGNYNVMVSVAAAFAAALLAMSVAFVAVNWQSATEPVVPHEAPPDW